MPAPTPADGVVWITGASAGIGRALALELVARGWKVAATARDGAALDALAAETKGAARGFPGDVTDRAAMDRIVATIEAEMGPLAIAVLNAGIYLPVRALPFEHDKFARTFEVNLMGTVNGLGAVIPPMVAREAGQIWITSSVAGYGGLPQSAAYGATKAGLINMASSLKFDLDLVGVHIGVINPGFVETKATSVNDFEMPFLMAPEAAAKRIADGFAKRKFEITFPRRFALILKTMNLLPYDWYQALAFKALKWGEKTLP